MITEIATLYRRMMQEGFKNAGSIEDPTVFIDSKAEGISICGQGRSDFMNIYIKAAEGMITDVRYLCNCDPTANVVVEFLCDMARGMTLDEAKSLKKEQFYKALGTSGGAVPQKVWGAIELMSQVIKRYEHLGQDNYRIFNPSFSDVTD
jgi:NifU-like protein involved in Fe-S cluster formation